MVPEISTHIDVLCSINFFRTGRKWWYRFIHWIWSAYVTVLQSKKQAMIKFLITNFLCLFSLHEKLVNSFTWPWLAKLPLCFVGRQHYFFKFNNSWHVPQYIYGYGGDHIFLFPCLISLSLSNCLSSVLWRNACFSKYLQRNRWKIV